MDHNRHLGIFQIPDTFAVGLIGAGGIGAMAALMLAKMGVPYLDVWDDDIVANENLATQLHKLADIGVPKVHGLETTLNLFSDDTKVFAHQARFGSRDSFKDAGQKYDLIVSAVDSMQSRHAIWNTMDAAIFTNQIRVTHYLDARMGAESYQQFLVPMFDRSTAIRYEQMLLGLTDDMMPDAPCTEKATFYTAAIAAGHIGKTVRDIVRNEWNAHRLVHNIPMNNLLMFKL
jgi:hypothetical protein